ncbi:MAG: sulfite exporter TauE/SafE family protein [Candidatus Omnitrophica bacterium]|nr:sulfite exporter TauE/SafE family protein [Candidatus Omnitrophota bacterium]
MIEDLMLSLEKVFLSHSILGIGASFLAGVIASFSPCIYPLLPVTAGVIGAYSLGSHRRGFLMSIVFVSGIAFIYTILGVLAATLGFFLGALAVNPLVYLGIGVFFLLLGLSLLDVVSFGFFRWQCDQSGVCRLTSPYVALFVAGMIAGFTALPCLFPIVGTILSLIALQRDIVYGGVSLFFFAFGYGMLLVGVGTFAGFISKLPKSGNWLIIVRKCVGIFLLILSGLFFLRAVTLF